MFLYSWSLATLFVDSATYASLSDWPTENAANESPLSYRLLKYLLMVDMFAISSDCDTMLNRSSL